MIATLGRREAAEPAAWVRAVTYGATVVWKRQRQDLQWRAAATIRVLRPPGLRLLQRQAALSRRLRLQVPVHEREERHGEVEAPGADITLNRARLGLVRSLL